LRRQRVDLACEVVHALSEQADRVSEGPQLSGESRRFSRHYPSVPLTAAGATLVVRTLRGFSL